jgi:hypothetical protein
MDDLGGWLAASRKIAARLTISKKQNPKGETS